MRIILTEAELALAKEIAHTRNDPKERAGVKSKMAVPTGKTHWRSHYDGARAEVAVAKQFNAEPDTSFSWIGDKHAPDLQIYSYSAEVKATAYNKPCILKFNALDEFKADMCTLCYVGNKDHKVVDIVGVVSREKFTADHYLRDFGYGERLCMDDTAMVSVELWEELRKGN